MKALVFCLTLLSLFLALPSAADDVPRDADGNRLIIDETTAATPGAGSGMGAVVGLAADTLQAWEKHRFDLRAHLLVGGTAGDGDPASETVISGFSILYRPNAVPWLRAGPDIQWDTVDRSKITVSIPFGFKIAPDPYASVNWWFETNFLPEIVVRTGETPEGVTRKTAISWDPSAAILCEIPMGPFSIEGGGGVSYPFTIEGVTDQAENPTVQQLAVGGRLGVNFRLRP